MAGFVGVVDYIEFLYMAGLYPLVCIGCSDFQYLTVNPALVGLSTIC